MIIYRIESITQGTGVFKSDFGAFMRCHAGPTTSDLYEVSEYFVPFFGCATLEYLQEITCEEIFGYEKALNYLCLAVYETNEYVTFLDDINDNQVQVMFNKENAKVRKYALRVLQEATEYTLETFPTID